MRIDPAILSFPQKRESRNKDNHSDSCLRRKDAATNAIQTFSNGTVLVDYGPMRMFISVFEDGKSLVTLAREGAHLAIRVLEDLAGFLPVIKKKAQGLEVEKKFPDVVQRMIEATQRMEEPDLTPLAAVAGTASDVVADFIFDQGGTKVIVDNGGDIAIRLRDGEVAKVGVKTDIHASRPSYMIAFDSTMGIGGVATSGLGGRSFTKGVASAATVLSKTAALADAAATVIGNFTNVDDPGIERSLAERIYPDTDIVGEWVTTEVRGLSLEKIEEALQHGLSKAYHIYKKGLMRGALIAVKGRVAWTSSLDSTIRKI